MKTNLFISFSIIFLFSACSSQYYLSETATEIPLYYDKSASGEVITFIPEGKEIIIKGERGPTRRKVKFQNYVGWTYSPYLIYSKKFNYSGTFRTTQKNTNYTSSFNKPSKIKKQGTKSYSNNSTRTYQYSDNQINRSGRVNVKGYYRKDGTYVRPHTRSYPNSRTSKKASYSPRPTYGTSVAKSKDSLLLKSKSKIAKPKRTYYRPSSTGRVQVRGYYRKDGTYVRPHTRSRPKSRTTSRRRRY